MCSELPLLVRTGHCLYLTGVSPPPLSHPHIWLVAPVWSPDWLQVFPFNLFPAEELFRIYPFKFFVFSLLSVTDSSWDWNIFLHSVLPLSSQLSLPASMLHWMQWICCRLDKNTAEKKIASSRNFLSLFFKKINHELRCFFFSFCSSQGQLWA